MKIKNRLYLGALISIALVVILGSVTLITSNELTEKGRVHDLANEMHLAISELDILTYEYLMSYEKPIEQEWNLKYHTTARNVGEELAVSIRVDYAMFGDLFSQLTANRKRMERLIQEGAPQEKIDATVLLEERLVPQLLAKSRSIITDTSVIVGKMRAEKVEAQELARNLTLALMLMLAIVVITTVLIVTRSISNPLSRLTDYARKVGEGEYTADIEIKGKDEIASVASDVKVMVGQLTQLQKKLLESERLATLGQFSGNISHELRNPLGVIDSSAYYLKTKLKDADEKVHEHLDRIKASVVSSTTIIESLLNLTRMEEPRLTKLDLTAVIADAIATSKIPAAVKVIRNFPEEEVPVNADPEPVRMAFKNIIKNAHEAMDGKGTLTVTVGRTTDGQAEVSFADTGPGIAVDDLEKVFHPLFSGKAQGIGFGLSITKMVADKHGGKIEARSEPGKGANIIMQFPLYTDKDKEA
ncbi:sensor histidine kinase [Chloroflexota bacterium]